VVGIVVLILVLILLTTVAVFFVLAYVIDHTIRAKEHRGPVSENFNGTVFSNIKSKEEQMLPLQKRSYGRLLRWLFTRPKNEWVDRPVIQTKPVERVFGNELVTTFINHATVLIQTEGLNIITDPIYSKRASPFSFLGPRRYTLPGVAFADLPAIDVVLISHNHYDHLDLATLKKLVLRNNPHLVVPLANKELLARHRMTNVTELDWWQSYTHSNGIEFVCVPAQHFSARALSDRNKTLWSGYVIRPNAGGDIYFAGDTGLGLFIDQIATRFPTGFKLGLLPIGAFRPQWAMHEVHISPDEAFTIQKKLNIQNVLAIHFGTFKLADDKQDEPKDRVAEILAATPIQGTFRVLANGERL
jgi:L-ascorbate metabolism protein UlaG (beta-lactamase superfamily)